MPVLPDVASRMILSRVRAPERSPSAIILAAGRSFTDPPGFCHSALAWSSTFLRSVSKLARRTSGVLPIRSTMDAGVRGPRVATDISDHSSGVFEPTEYRIHQASPMASLLAATAERPASIQAEHTINRSGAGLPYLESPQADSACA